MAQAVERLEDLGAARTIFAPIGRLPVEVAAFAFLDARHRVIAVRQMSAGRLDRIEVPIRIVARAALVLEAAGVVMAHNHPSSVLEPSEADIVVTRRAERVFGELGVKLIDHLIVARRGVVSLRGLGLL